MFRRTDMDPKRKDTIRRPWKVSINRSACFANHAYEPEPMEIGKDREKKYTRDFESLLVCGKNIRNNFENRHIVGTDKIMVSLVELSKC